MVRNHDRQWCEIMIGNDARTQVDSDELHKIFPLPSGNGPIPPDPTESGLALPGYRTATERPPLPPDANAPIPTPRDNPGVSIMSMSGAVLTVWGRSKNSWL